MAPERLVQGITKNGGGSDYGHRITSAPSRLAGGFIGFISESQNRFDLAGWLANWLELPSGGPADSRQFNFRQIAAHQNALTSPHRVACFRIVKEVDRAIFGVRRPCCHAQAWLARSTIRHILLIWLCSSYTFQVQMQLCMYLFSRLTAFEILGDQACM